MPVSDAQRAWRAKNKDIVRTYNRRQYARRSGKDYEAPALTTWDRFMSYVVPEPNSGCWLWDGPVYQEGGYARFNLDGVQHKGHRFIFELLNGPLPGPEIKVRHACDVTCCVNPEHLSSGTTYDNVQDMILRGRRVQVCGDRHGMAKLSGVDIPLIRERAARGDTYTAIARDYGVSGPVISCAVNRRTWKHIP